MFKRWWSRWTRPAVARAMTAALTPGTWTWGSFTARWTPGAGCQGAPSAPGQMIDQAMGYTVDATGQQVNLISLKTRNTATTPASGNLYGLKIETETAAYDTGAGIAIFNKGNSDCLYLGVMGVANQSGSNPTGIGIDLNRGQDGSGQQTGWFSGRGVQVFDFSQGGGDGAQIYLDRPNNPNNSNHGIVARTNRNALDLVTPEGAGYDPNAPLLTVKNEAGATKLIVSAEGNLSLFGGRGLYLGSTENRVFSGVTGGTSERPGLTLAGPGGVWLVNEAGEAVALVVQNGALGVRGADGVVRPVALGA